jgi:ATP-binding cassette subfamily D (ALD) long-chain fatty acid import protein
MYGTAKAEGITFITISHRPALFKYHNFLLRIGEGNDGKSWTLAKIGNATSLLMSIDNEIKSIEEKLSKEAGYRVRLDAINKELNIHIDTKTSATVKRSLI